MTVADECAKILNCPIKSLRDHLNHPTKRARIIKELTGRQVQTTYLDRSGNKHCFRINGLTKNGADLTMAYGRLRRPYNICIAAHYYARHRIRLEYPYLPCAIQSFPAPGEDRYYALELLEFVDIDENDADNDVAQDAQQNSTTTTTTINLTTPNLPEQITINCTCDYRGDTISSSSNSIISNESDTSEDTEALREYCSQPRSCWEHWGMRGW